MAAIATPTAFVTGDRSVSFQVVNADTNTVLWSALIAAAVTAVPTFAKSSIGAYMTALAALGTITLATASMATNGFQTTLLGDGVGASVQITTANAGLTFNIANTFATLRFSLSASATA